MPLLNPFVQNMREPGIEPGTQAWEARIIPFNYPRITKLKRISILFNNSSKKRVRQPRLSILFFGIAFVLKAVGILNSGYRVSAYRDSRNLWLLVLATRCNDHYTTAAYGPGRSFVFFVIYRTGDLRRVKATSFAAYITVFVKCAAARLRVL